MKAKSIMIQGTASSVGKSLITAGLCRVFKQDGYRVAPFKSQNMALNSFITKEGGEMGRAQVVQAEAAGLEPSVEMNPILMKPIENEKAQIIINGKVYGNMTAAEYFSFKPQLADMIRNTYNGLSEKNDIIVIEGAGSPAEINLREKDFVNMGMAEIADAPVLLVGDIDKGGVFAALAGTMLLLTEDERKRVKGVIINKFRGDISILEPGLQMLEDIIKIPVLGVIPYTELKIEEEDSLSDRYYQTVNSSNNDIKVAVIKLPHMSNFTDFNALENIQGVCLRYVDSAMELENADLIILPGSKNTIGDLLYIREKGMEAAIKRLQQKGTAIIGVCGGYQMLGVEISDPYKTETELGSVKGMGLLNIKTVFQRDKTTTQVKAMIIDGFGMLEGLEGMTVEGYEIHMGTTEYLNGCIPYLKANSVLGQHNIKIDGVRNDNVFGTYIHGIFDNMEFSAGLVNNLRKRKGLEKTDTTAMSFKEFKESQYDKLADLLRRNLDIERIYSILF